MIHALIFDMDGLIVDTEPLYWDVARQLARRYGSSVTDATLRRMMGRSRLESMRIFTEDCAITQIAPEDLLIEREQLMLDRYAAGMKPMPGLHEILARFRASLHYAVATSSPRKFADVLLSSLQIVNEFEMIQTGDEINNGKPNPEIYLKCMSRLSLAGSDCIVLEDSHAGAQSGKRAGATVIAVPSPLTAVEDFSTTADYRVSNLNEAADLIAKIIDPR